VNQVISKPADLSVEFLPDHVDVHFIVQDSL